MTPTSVADGGRRSGPVRLLDELGDWAAGPGPVHRRLARALAGAVDRGVLPVGTRLPSERALADRLSVSRGTVLAAYGLLAGDGLVDRRHGSGTYVADPAPPAGGMTAARGLPPDREGSALVHHLADASRLPGALIDLSLSVTADLGDLDLPPLTLADLRDAVPPSGYSPWGLPGLRAAVATHVGRWGLPVAAGSVVVTTGAQQAIAVAAACWVRPGDVVVTEDPTYPGAVAAFRQAGARVVGVPVDDRGVVVDALAAAVAAHGPALVYLQPVAQSPTGSVLGPARRRAVAGVVDGAGVPVVEDLALADTSWMRPPPPLATFVRRAPVAVVGSLSKGFWGGLRVGFAVVPEPLAPRFARVKATFDLGSSVPGQLLAERLLTGGAGDHLDRRRRRLEDRADHLMGVLADRLPSWRWTAPQGGLSLWVRLPGGYDTGAFARRALAAGVVVAPPGPLSPTDGHRDRLRLSFDLPPDRLDEGVGRLASAWSSRNER